MKDLSDAIQLLRMFIVMYISSTYLYSLLEVAYRTPEKKLILMYFIIVYTLKLSMKIPISRFTANKTTFPFTVNKFRTSRLSVSANSHLVSINPLWGGGNY